MRVLAYDPFLSDERAEGPVRGGGHEDGGLPDGEQDHPPRDEDELAPARVGHGPDDDGVAPPRESLRDEPSRIDGSDRGAVEGPEEGSRIQGSNSIQSEAGASSARIGLAR